MSAANSSRKPGGDAAGTLLRVLFAAVFATAGFLLGRELYERTLSLHVASQFWQITLLIVVPVVGALLGVLLTPYAQVFFEGALVTTELNIERMAPGELAGGVLGLIAGLIIAFLIKNILFDYISFVGEAGVYVAAVLYLIVSVFAAYLGARVGAKQRMRLVGASALPARSPGSQKIIDTSVIVDGRIVELVESGFLEPPFIVPRFVLHEVQLIADSTDSIKRSRGRRALEVLGKLQEIVPLEISERDYSELGETVDAKLVRLARELDAKLVTNDYNLNRVAHVEGVTVLNINELANAVKPIVLPGEEMHVAILREGKEAQQGIGYLDDGTMIVVENGRRLIGESTEVVVTSVLQTVAGRMIFAKTKR